MTSAGFDALVSDGALLALEVQAHMADRFGDQPRWDVDLARGTFTFSGPSTGEQVFGVQLLGSTAPTPRTWMWGWANPAGFPEPVLRASRAVRELGERYGIPELATGEIPFPDGDQDGQDLATRIWIVSRVASGDWFGYRGQPNPGQWVYLLLTGEGLTLPEPGILRTLRIAGEAAQLGLLTDARRAFASYATLRGLGWDGSVLTMPDGDLTVEVDDAGRLVRMGGTAGPGGATA